MGYVIVEMAVLLAAAVFLGIGVGWLMWRVGRTRLSSSELAALDQDRRQLKSERDQARTALQRKERDYVRLRANHDSLLSERSQILVDRDAIRSEVETLRRDRDRAEHEVGFPREVDDLQAVNGIDATLESALHREGIHSFRQLARLSQDGLDRLRDALAEGGCVVRPVDWADQARLLHRDKYGTDPS